MEQLVRGFFAPPLGRRRTGRRARGRPLPSLSLPGRGSLPCANKDKGSCERFLQITEQFQWLVYKVPCTPGFRRTNIAEIAIFSNNRFHACRQAGLDVAQVVAEIDAFSGWNSYRCAGRQQWLGMRFGVRGIATADN